MRNYWDLWARDVEFVPFRNKVLENIVTTPTPISTPIQLEPWEEDFLTCTGGGAVLYYRDAEDCFLHLCYETCEDPQNEGSTADRCEC